ncbi:siderophore-interacting protein [uncultured Tateyamaria sp.]|uniref:siderophore-interacting protein n=1 Tax=uncultured Tateyamaria sp. TaxID=455651 RepID=UPI0026160491|nr:siderophore-interacting protein [uncultured Tateyamaria sp.]
MKVYSDIDGLGFSTMRKLMLNEATEHGLPVLEQGENRLRIKSDYGAFGIIDRSANGFRIEIEADGAGNLHVLRDSLVAHIADFQPDVAAQIAWSDAVQDGLRPPNFQFAKVKAATRLSASFQRLTLVLSKPDSFGDRAIHFRFVLPRPDNPAPEWPTLAANGSTRWPEGDKALHRPVYTVRAQRWAEIDVDVFLHEGGRASEWALGVASGTSVALIGPGGGGVLDAARVVLAGDETAYPAISRIIESLPGQTRGKVILLSHAKQQDYPVPHHVGLTPAWVGPDDFVRAVSSAASDCMGGYVWAAADAGQINALRNCDEIAHHPKAQRYVATYWKRT